MSQPVSHQGRVTKRVVLSKGELPHLIQFAQATFKPGDAVDPHTHCDMNEVFWVHSGEGTITITGEAHELKPGVCVTIEPNEVHSIMNDGDCDLVLYYFAVEE